MCFGCGAAGDVFAFLEKYKNLNFAGSVRELARRYGVPLVDTGEVR
jgi:DNA primase